MKTRLLIALLLLLLPCLTSGLSRPSRYEYEYPGRFTPSVKKEKLSWINFTGEITPELWNRLAVPHKERVRLDHWRILDFTPYPYRINYKEYYDKLIEYVSVEILATCNGKSLASQSRSDKLTAEQKNILNTADLGSDIRIKIRFRHKNQSGKTLDRNEIIEGELTVTVVPETEAEFPGGVKQLTEYIQKNVFDKISEPGASGKVQQAIVKFTVTEEGRLLNPRIVRSSRNLQLDRFVLDAIAKMPNWKSAQNSRGMKVQQEFSIALGSNNGC
jgi:TonB family protein